MSVTYLADTPVQPPVKIFLQKVKCSSLPPDLIRYSLRKRYFITYCVAVGAVPSNHLESIMDTIQHTPLIDLKSYCF